MNIAELCVNCKQNNSCTMCWKTSNKKCPHFIQKTNADRIRAMSDEELAKLFTQTVANGCPPDMDWMCKKDEEGWDACDSCWLKWLQQPAEEDKL